MTRNNIFKRTIIPRHDKTEKRESPSSEVRTYFLSSDELEKYRQMPKAQHNKPIVFLQQDKN